MSKARETWRFKEFATSEKLNRTVVDTLSPGMLIMHANGFFYDEAALSPPVPADPIYLGWFPYNPGKIIYDRMRIQGLAVSGGHNTEYSIDSGASWTSIVPATGSIPVPMSVVWTTVNPTNFIDVDLSGILNLQWLGLRIDRTSSWTDTFAAWNFQVFLYSSTASPF